MLDSSDSVGVFEAMAYKIPIMFLLTLARFSTRKSPWPAQALKVMSLASTVVAFTALCRLTNGFYLFFQFHNACTSTLIAVLYDDDD